jgi:hypothetical protein
LSKNRFILLLGLSSQLSAELQQRSGELENKNLSYVSAAILIEYPGFKFLCSRKL